MSAHPELTVAVIGTGQMGARHVATYQRIEHARLLAVADSSPSARHAALCGAPSREYDDWRVLLDREAANLDAVSIACPSALHAEVASAALECGLHVLVEKPIATTIGDALELAALAHRVERKLMVGHIERFNPAIQKVRRLVAEGRLGRVYRAHGTRVGPLPRRDLNAGVALDLATHDLDAMEFVLQRNLVQVFAQGGRFSHDEHEDLLTCLLRFDGGPFGLLDVNWLTPEKQRELVLLGEAGMLRASYITQDVWFIESGQGPAAWQELALIRGEGEGSAIRFAVRKVEPIRAELEAFVDCVLYDTHEPVDAYDGARALAAALAVLESTAEEIPISPVEVGLPRRWRAELEVVA
jgi:UDP-N-acetylglucosamine 3-dehydrogenase